jgi:hypothetical protein
MITAKYVGVPVIEAQVVPPHDVHVAPDAMGDAAVV